MGLLSSGTVTHILIGNILFFNFSMLFWVGPTLIVYLHVYWRWGWGLDERTDEQMDIHTEAYIEVVPTLKKTVGWQVYHVWFNI